MDNMIEILCELNGRSAMVAASEAIWRHLLTIGMHENSIRVTLRQEVIADGTVFNDLIVKSSWGESIPYATVCFH